MTLTRDVVAARLRRLAGTLAELKVRVRAAVATETGRVVAEAVNDLLAAALAGRPTPAPTYRPTPGYRSAYGRADADDDPRAAWTDEDDEPRPGWSANRDESDLPARRASMTANWPAVLTLTATVVKNWANRRLPGWAAATLGLLAGVVVLAGGPLVPAGLALAGAALDLFPQALPTLPY